jgi:hypothetical protein
MKLALAAAAVVALAVTGFALMPKPASNVSSPPSATPTASPLPTIPQGSVPPGAYSVTQFTGTPFTLTVPAGWNYNKDDYLTKGFWPTTGIAFATWQVTHIFTDPCHWSGTDTAEPTKDKLVAGLIAQSGHQVTGPTETTLGGYPATRLVLSIPDTDVTTCEGASALRLWPDPGDDFSGGQLAFRGETYTLYIVDDGGVVTVLGTIAEKDVQPGDLAEAQSILDSIQLRR